MIPSREMAALVATATVLKADPDRVVIRMEYPP